MTPLVGVLFGLVAGSARTAGGPDEVAKDFMEACWTVTHGDAAAGRRVFDGLMAAPNSATIPLAFEAAHKESPWMFDGHAHGADNPRPFRSKVTPRGQLRIIEWSSIYVDVKPIPKATW